MTEQRDPPVAAMPAAADRPTPVLLDRFLHGRDSAYGVLFERYRQPLIRYISGHCQASLRRYVSPDDLLQETHLEALKSIASFTYRRQLSFFFWLCRIASRRIWHHGQQLAKRPQFQASACATRASASSAVELFDVMHDPKPGPEAQLLLNVNLHLVAAALDDLPEEIREAILLRRIEGYSTRETAELLGTSDNAVKLRLSRGVRRLRANLDALLGA